MEKEKEYLPLLLTITICALVCNLLVDEKYIHNLMAKTFENSSRRRNEFVACVSHELRSPLNGIVGCVDLLELQPQTMPLSSVKEKLAIIRHCTALLSLLLENVLAQGADPQIILEEVNCEELFAPVMAILETLAWKKDLRIEMHLSESLPKRIVLCKSAVTQVLLNLGANAVKFNENGIIEIRASIDGPDLLVEVIDDGPGVKEEFVSRLFTAYARDYSSGANRSPGTGLGLSICKKMVVSMNGSIGYAAKPKTSFWFRFPFKESRKGSVKCGKRLIRSREIADVGVGFLSQVQDDDRLLNFDVLLVEDNNVNAFVMQKMLERIGKCKVTIVGEGAAALIFLLERIRAVNPFSLRKLIVLLDWNMPILNGAETLVQWRSLEKVSGIPRTHVIFFSAQLVKLEDNVDVDAVLTKPVSFAELKKLIMKFGSQK